MKNEKENEEWQYKIALEMGELVKPYLKQDLQNTIYGICIFLTGFSKSIGLNGKEKLEDPFKVWSQISLYVLTSLAHMEKQREKDA